MEKVSQETLLRINQAFPSVQWGGQELEELVAPRQGLITGFRQLLDEIERLRGTDLEDLGVAAAPANGSSPEETTAAAFGSLGDLSRAFRAARASPAERVDACLKRIDAVNETTKALITVAGDRARQEAREAELEIGRGARRGPLHGVPYVCKDMFLTRGLRTTGGSRVLEDWVPERDALVVERLRAAGAVLLGKANQHEFAYGATGRNDRFGTVCNPFDETRLAGGSSSGSAAAVASGLADFALGTDTGGSVRVPACLCGVVGLKPTYGLVPTDGVIPYCWSLDHVGIISRTVPDAALVLDALAAPPAWNTARDPFGLSIGVPRRFFFDDVDPEIEAAVRRALDTFRSLGLEIVDIDMPPMEETRTVSLLLQLPEMLSYHSRYLPEKMALYGEDVRSGMAAGQFILAEHYVRARRMKERYKRRMADVFREVDLIVTPTCPVVAPKIDAITLAVGRREEPVGNAITRFTSFFNVVELPALSLPCGVHSTGLPMGIQLVGRPREEQTLLCAARRLEETMDL